jgi:hypothetical protein
MKLSKTLFLAAAMFTAFSCEKSEVVSRKPLDDSPLFRDLATGNSSARIQGSNLAVYTAEYLASKESGQVGRTVYFNDLGNKQLSADFVPGLSLDGTHDVSYYIDENRPSADLPVATSTAAIARAMVTWESVACSELGLHTTPLFPPVTLRHCLVSAEASNTPPM